MKLNYFETIETAIGNRFPQRVRSGHLTAKADINQVPSDIGPRYAIEFTFSSAVQFTAKIDESEYFKMKDKTMWHLQNSQTAIRAMSEAVFGDLRKEMLKLMEYL